LGSEFAVCFSNGKSGEDAKKMPRIIMMMIRGLSLYRTNFILLPGWSLLLFGFPQSWRRLLQQRFFRFLTGSLICCSMTVSKRGRLRAFRVASALTAEDSAVVFRILIADWTFPASFSCVCFCVLPALAYCP
jgi:hypothetical protein